MPTLDLPSPPRGGRASPDLHRVLRTAAAVALAVALLAAGGGVRAAADDAAVLRSRLEAAVRDHEAGRLRRAQRTFEALARRGVPAAQADLAVMHLRGEVPKPDPALARRLLESAATAPSGGFVAAQLMLAQGLEAGLFGATRDLVRAHDWYERAARAGSVEAQLAMGTAFYLGRGRPRDPAQAAAWFLTAARGGDVGAMYLLASMHERGDGAVARDLRLARYWYGVAGASGDPAAAGKAAEVDALLAAEARAQSVDPTGGKSADAAPPPTAPP